MYQDTQRMSNSKELVYVRFARSLFQCTWWVSMPLVIAFGILLMAGACHFLCMQCMQCKIPGKVHLSWNRGRRLLETAVGGHLWWAGVELRYSSYLDSFTLSCLRDKQPQAELTGRSELRLEAKRGLWLNLRSEVERGGKGRVRSGQVFVGWLGKKNGKIWGSLRLSFDIQRSPVDQNNEFCLFKRVSKLKLWKIDSINTNNHEVKWYHSAWCELEGCFWRTCPIWGSSGC